MNTLVDRSQTSALITSLMEVSVTLIAGNEASVVVGSVIVGTVKDILVTSKVVGAIQIIGGTSLTTESSIRINGRLIVSIAIINGR